MPGVCFPASPSPPAAPYPNTAGLGPGWALMPPQAGEGPGPLLPSLTLKLAHPLSCQLVCKGICPRGALSSLIRKVVTDTLAAGGEEELRAVTRLRKTKCLLLPRLLGPIWARHCGWGRDRDTPSSESPPQLGLAPGTQDAGWGSSPFLAALAVCLLAGPDCRVNLHQLPCVLHLGLYSPEAL